MSPRRLQAQRRHHPHISPAKSSSLTSTTSIGRRGSFPNHGHSFMSSTLTTMMVIKMILYYFMFLAIMVVVVSLQAAANSSRMPVVATKNNNYNYKNNNNNIDIAQQWQQWQQAQSHHHYPHYIEVVGNKHLSGKTTTTTTTTLPSKPHSPPPPPTSQHFRPMRLSSPSFSSTKLHPVHQPSGTTTTTTTTTTTKQYHPIAPTPGHHENSRGLQQQDGATNNNDNDCLLPIGDILRSGQQDEDHFGRRVSISQNGQFVAVGGRLYDGVAGTGLVQVYENTNVNNNNNNNNNGHQWIQRGNNIEIYDRLFGNALSNDGNTLAVGAEFSHSGFLHDYVRVYQFNVALGDWQQLGNTLAGLTLEDQFGFSVALSGDGTILAVNAPFGGQVRVFLWNGSTTTWADQGDPINGQNSGIALSENGNILAVGAYEYDANGKQDSGSVQVFEFTNNIWNPLGQAMYGDNADDRFGFSVSLSSDGHTVAVGASGSFSNSQVQVHYYNENVQQWTQHGRSLYQVGDSVSLSGDGLILAVGAPQDYGGKGFLRVFRWDDGPEDWQPFGNDLVGTTWDDGLGEAVAVSRDGSTVVVGGDAYGTGRPGLAMVVQLEATCQMTSPTMSPKVSPMVSSTVSPTISPSTTSPSMAQTFGPGTFSVGQTNGNSVVLLGSIVAVAGVLIALGVFCYLKRRRRLHGVHESQPAVLELNNEEAPNYDNTAGTQFSDSLESNIPQSPAAGTVPDLDLDRALLKDLIEKRSEKPVVLKTPVYVETVIDRSQELGKGFFGVVFKGMDSVLGASFAIKTVNRELVAYGNKAEVNATPKTFQREIETLATFKHPNIASLLASHIPTNIRGEMYLVYDLAEKGSLDAFWMNDFGRERLSSTLQRIQIALEVFSAVRFLHVGSPPAIRACFHHDIKSANICLKHDFTAQLIDCGLAKFVHDEQTIATSTGVKGTAGYICPAYQSGDLQCFEKACDIFSFGVVLAEILTGRLQNSQQANSKRSYNFHRVYIKERRLIENDIDSALDVGTGSLLPDYIRNLCRLAIACMSADPDDHPEGEEVISKLQNIFEACRKEKETNAATVSSWHSNPQPEHHKCWGTCAFCKVEGECVPFNGDKLLCISCTLFDFHRIFLATLEANQKVCKNIQSLREENRELHAISHRKLDHIHAVLACLDSRLINPIPRLFVLVPTSRQGKWDLRRMVRQKLSLYFVCAHSGRAVNPAITLNVSRDWVDKVAPALLFSLKLIKVAGFAVTGLSIDISGALSSVIDLDSQDLNEIVDSMKEGLDGREEDRKLISRINSGCLKASDVQCLNDTALVPLQEKANDQMEWRNSMSCVRVKGQAKTLWVLKEFADEAMYVRV